MIRINHSLVRSLYIFGLALMVASIPLSRYLMSLSQFILAGVFLWDGINEKRIGNYFSNHLRSLSLIGIIPLVISEVFANMIRRFRLFFTTKPAIIFCSIILLHLVGLIYTQNFDYALHDLKTKLPLFLLPLYISTSKPLNNKTLYNLLLEQL